MRIKLYSCGSEQPESEIPLSLGYLKTNVKNSDISIEKDKNSLKDCDLIGISATAHGIKEAVSILNNTTIPVVLGGQATLWNGIADYNFKHIVIGDGEPALQSIVNGSTERIIKSSNNLDLNSLAFPERGQLRDGKAPMFTSRGCPFSCAFCSSQQYWENVRYVSPEYFIDEVHDILNRYKQDVRWLYIMDDLFIGNIKRFYLIYDLWMKHGLNKRLQLWSFVRSNIFTKDIGLKMREMGFRSIRFGAESGSDRILTLLNKNSTVEINQRAINISNEIGLPIHCSFMYDIPTETQEEKQMTLDFINKNKGKMEVSGFYKFCYFPGTSLYTNQNPMKDNMSVR